MDLQQLTETYCFQRIPRAPLFSAEEALMSTKAKNNAASSFQQSETKPVTMRLRRQTLDRINELRDLTGKNRTQVVADAVMLANRLAKAQQEGSKLLIKESDGTCIQIEFLGL